MINVAANLKPAAISDGAGQDIWTSFRQGVPTQVSRLTESSGFGNLARTGQ